MSKDFDELWEKELTRREDIPWEVIDVVKLADAALDLAEALDCRITIELDVKPDIEHGVRGKGQTSMGVSLELKRVIEERWERQRKETS